MKMLPGAGRRLSASLAALAVAMCSAQPLTAQSPAGFTPRAPVDTIVQSLSTNRSAVIGFAGTASAASSSSTSLTVGVTSNFVSQGGARSGIPMVGHTVTGSGIPAGTNVTGVTDNGSNSFTLTLSQPVTVASGAAVTSAGPQQVMAANPTRRGFSQQNQGASAKCYQNGVGAAVIGPDGLLLAAGAYYESKDSHVGTGAIVDICDTAATPIFAREW